MKDFLELFFIEPEIYCQYRFQKQNKLTNCIFSCKNILYIFLERIV